MARRRQWQLGDEKEQDAFRTASNGITGTEEAVKGKAGGVGRSYLEELRRTC